MVSIILMFRFRYSLIFKDVMRKIYFILSFAFLFSCTDDNKKFSNKVWEIQKSDQDIYLNFYNAKDNYLELEYAFYGTEKVSNKNRWLALRNRINESSLFDKLPLVLRLKSESKDILELKLIDEDGSVFGTKISLENKYNSFSEIVIYKNNVSYLWGGKNDVLDNIKYFEIAISGNGKGKLYLQNLYFDTSKPKSKLPILNSVIDSLYDIKGFGFLQRRDSVLTIEDPLVLEYLKDVQDYSSKEMNLLPSQEGNEVSTFNNALVAMAFILKDEKERAERILDYYKRARIKENNNLELQNFYFNGEARGYYQYSNLNTKKGNKANHQLRNSDRWMGDNTWLTIAYLYYRKKYKSTKYDSVINDLKQLLISWYISLNDKKGGYLGHGWRNVDTKLHEISGHEEGNIDAYALFKLFKENEYSNNIRSWLDNSLHGKNLPLDLYTWRTLAYGNEFSYLLDIPESDFRYRKVIDIKGKKVMGFFHGPDINVNNIWLDGTGHVACAYISFGDKYRGYFYANQLDNFIIESKIGGRVTHTLPYTLSKEGGYNWVNHNKGFISVAAWYIFAKNKFNPLTFNHNQ